MNPSDGAGFTVTWHFLPAAGREECFRSYYAAPDGPWCRLFRLDPSYLGTEFGTTRAIHRSPGRPGCFSQEFPGPERAEEIATA